MASNKVLFHFSPSIFFYFTLRCLKLYFLIWFNRVLFFLLSCCDKFSRDFTDGNIPSVYTEGITVGTKIKTKKKNDDVSFFTNGITDGIFSVGNSVGKLWTLFIMSITKGITDGIFQIAPELFTFQLHY